MNAYSIPQMVARLRVAKLSLVAKESDLSFSAVHGIVNGVDSRKSTYDKLNAYLVRLDKEVEAANEDDG